MRRPWFVHGKFNSRHEKILFEPIDRTILNNTRRRRCE